MFPTTRLPELRREIRATWILALPLVVGQVLSIAMNVVDTMLAGHLGTNVLAAVSMGYQAWVLVILVLMGLMLAVTPAVAQLDGAGRRGEVGAVFRQSLWLALAAGSLLLVALRNAEPLLRLAGVAPAIVPNAVAFLHAIAWGAPALALFFACRHTSEGLSLTRPTLYVSALGIVLLAPLAWALMYGRLGLPALGAAGAGYAHAIVLWIQVAAFLVYLSLHRQYREAKLFARFDAPAFEALVRLLRVGVPMGVSIFMEGSLFVVTAWMIGSSGEVAASAHAIAINVASFTFMVPLGIAQATTVRVGNAVGRGESAGVRGAGAAGFAIVLATQAVSATMLLSLPTAIAGLYSDDATVTTLAAALLGYAALFQLSDGVQVLFNGALRGLEDTLVPALLTIFAYWCVGLPVGWWLGRELHQGPMGFWKGLIAGLTTAALLLSTRFVLRTRSSRSNAVRAT